MNTEMLSSKLLGLMWFASLLVCSPFGVAHAQSGLNQVAGPITIENPVDGSEGLQQAPLCLDVRGGSTTDGAGVIVWDCHGGDNQLWLREYPAIGDDRQWFLLRNVHSNKCLQIRNGSASGGEIVQATCRTTPEQLFFTLGSNRTTVVSTWFTVLDLRRAELRPGNDVLVWPDNGQWNQQWTFE
jgi:hypothetical protein